MRLATFAIGAALLVGCGGSPAPTTSATPTAGSVTTSPSGAAPVVVGPMQFVLDKDGTVALEVRADGSIVLPSGKIVATFDGRKLVGVETGKGLVVEDDGTIHSLAPHAEQDEHLKFNDQGDIVTLAGDRIVVGDDGAVSYSKKGAPLKSIEAHVKGVTPATHRMAALLTLVAFVAHAKLAPPPPPSGSPPPTPAPTPAPTP